VKASKTRNCTLKAKHYDKKNVKEKLDGPKLGANTWMMQIWVASRVLGTSSDP